MRKTHSNTRRIRMFYVNCLQQFMIIYFILRSSVPFIFFSPESDTWNSSWEQIWGLHLHIYVPHMYAQHINKHIGSVPHAWRSLSDNGISWLITVSLSIPSLPVKWSSSRSDEEHVKEHIQHVSTAAVWNCGFNLNNSPWWKSLMYDSRNVVRWKTARLWCLVDECPH